MTAGNYQGEEFCCPQSNPCSVHQMLSAPTRSERGDYAMKYVVVFIGYDGTPSVTGPFKDEYAATLFGNAVETDESGMFAFVRELEAPAKVREELGLVV